MKIETAKTLMGIAIRLLIHDKLAACMRKEKASILILFILFILKSGVVQAEHPFNIVKERIKIPMRDGVNLGATLYRPDQPGKFPAIVFRTPYGKDDYDSSAELPMKAAKAGYIVFLVDVRGRYTSEGTFRAYHQEKQDGYDTIEWVGHSTYCTGKVGTYGQSYPGFVQWLALSEAPPSLKAAAPSLTPIDSHHFFYVGGGFSYTWFDWFMPYILADLRRRAGDVSGPIDETIAETQWESEKMQWYRFRPLVENPLLKKYAPYYYDWLTHPEKTDFWDFATVKDFHKIQAPTLLLSGWFDSVYGTVGATEAFNRMRKEAATPEARERTRLILGPWNHISINVHRNNFGIMNHGASAGFDYDNYLINWYDQQLKDKAPENIPPVSIFVMGAGRWRYENEWPLTRAIQTPFYLNKDQGLDSKAPSSEAADSYVFDPEHPVWDPSNARSYPFDQRDIEARKDVLTYTSAPLEKEMEVTGQLIAELFVSSSATDTDFAVTLCDVQPDGTSVNLTPLDAGFLRMRYRTGYTKAELMQPGNVYKITINNLFTSYLYPKGHRVRLQITSSRTPHYDPNTNTGTNLATETRLLKATQHIHTGGKYPSRVVLPVIPAE